MHEMEWRLFAQPAKLAKQTHPGGNYNLSHGALILAGYEVGHEKLLAIRPILKVLSQDRRERVGDIAVMNRHCPARHKPM